MRHLVKFDLPGHSDRTLLHNIAHCRPNALAGLDEHQQYDDILKAYFLSGLFSKAHLWKLSGGGKSAVRIAVERYNYPFLEQMCARLRQQAPGEKLSEEELNQLWNWQDLNDHKSLLDVVVKTFELGKPDRQRPLLAIWDFAAQTNTVHVLRSAQIPDHFGFRQHAHANAAAIVMDPIELDMDQDAGMPVENIDSFGAMS